ncbi:hypothetical protein WBG78_11360 [Chryseolinea sp. T2]|uniref:hypothetical protein n=1 Tax=Chryseolinea sp. T2 TaxID=3129255 RepID=UPI00307762BE
MNVLVRLVIFSVVGLFFSSMCTVCAQQTEAPRPEFNRNKVSLSITHTHVPTGINENGQSSWLMLPSWSLDYDYSLTDKWGAGLHTDLVIEDFQYEKEEGIILKRSKPFSMALVGTRRFGEHISIFAGGGMEVASEGTLGLFRLGGDCGWEIPNDWELSLSLVFDFKIDNYNAWVLGFGVGKRF